VGVASSYPQPRWVVVEEGGDDSEVVVEHHSVSSLEAEVVSLSLLPYDLGGEVVVVEEVASLH